MVDLETETKRLSRRIGHPPLYFAMCSWKTPYNISHLLGLGPCCICFMCVWIRITFGKMAKRV